MAAVFRTPFVDGDPVGHIVHVDSVFQESACCVSTQPTQVDYLVAFRFVASNGAEADRRSGCFFALEAG